MVGTTLQHYKIVRALGHGGMGEVYAAEDLHLHRQVALKILPPEMALDPERLHRFQREAQAIAALNHPNIVTLYGVEQAGGVHFLTMELVEGQTLEHELPPGGLPLPRVLEIAVPLTDAVRAAHEHGIVHRDLKPANIMFGAEGRLKVLDFGLAKQTRHAATGAESETVTGVAVTAEHKILGTAAYMSPEQAEGRPVDHRTDIFSLGVVLYEVATGARPFTGASVMTVLSAIIKDSPPSVMAVNPRVSREFDRIVMRCLEKDPARRYQSALELRKDLEAAREHAGTATGLAAGARALAHEVRRRWKWMLALAVLALMAVAAVWIPWRNFGARPAGPTPLQASYSQVTSSSGVEQYPSLSPDGQWVVYSAQEAGHRRIVLQSVSGQNPFPITKDPTVDDDQPAFSPDGERIAFQSSRDGGGLFVMGRTGEAVKRLTRAGFNPSWAPDGTKIVFATENVQLTPMNWEGTSHLWTVDVNTEASRRLSDVDAVQPDWSPHNQRIAFAGRLADRQMHIYTMPVGGGTPAAVTSGTATDWSPVWAPDGRHLYFASDRGGSMNLWRVPIDEASGRPTGEPEAITTPAPFLAHPSLSADGRRIAYSAVLETQNIQRLPFDPVAAKVTGDPEWLTTGSRRWSSPDVSQDGQWLAFQSRVQPEGHLYVMRSDRTGLSQLPSDDKIDRVPRWSPSGDWIAFFSNRSGGEHLQLWKIRPDGSGRQQLTNSESVGITTWSPDGSRIAVSAVAGAKTYVFDPNRPWQEQTPQVLPAPAASERALVATSWSPDGQQLACQTGFNEGGSSPHLGIVTYSFKSGTYQRLTDYGEWPVWLGDSRRILFVARGKAFYVLDSQTKTVTQVFAVENDTIGPPRLPGDGRAIYFTRRVTEADINLVTLR